MIQLVCTPTEYLIRQDPKELNPLGVLRLAREGFELADVESMLSACQLYQSNDILGRIVGRSAKAVRKQIAAGKTFRLSYQQSVLAYQYAKVLESATSVFGCQRIAEEWLSKPCKQLAGIIPLDAIDNAIGFRTVEDYLERVVRGVYQ